MMLIGERTVVSAGGRRGGEVVVVEVKMDAMSNELLTWALMKVAHPGDLVIALHVLDSVSEFAGGTDSILSLVKAFDSFLSVYEGFCNLKQVALKLKVCRGPSARKILVREVRASSADKVVVGASKAHQTICWSTSVAKYCARKLPKSVSVFAVRNGKIMFQREVVLASVDSSQEKLNQESQVCSQASHHEDLVSCAPGSSLVGACGTHAGEDSGKDGADHNPLALLPFQRVDKSVVEGTSESKHGWSLLRWILVPKQHNPEKSHLKKTKVAKWALKLPSQNSSSMVYPDQKQSTTCLNDHCSDLEGENGSLVAIGPSAEWSPVSLYNGSSDLPEELKGLQEKYSSSCRLFTYEELLMATSNFMPENLVGKGGSSHVYRGCLPDGKELAVKILRPSENVLKEFLVEVEIITTLHHKNIISLFGFCFEHNNLLLVYDFLSRGSAEENLHGNKKDLNAFNWHKRYKVAVGVAEALDHLHNSCDQPVIHKDVKSSNILLSDDFDPLLSDFGLSIRVSKSSSIKTCTDVTGTFGYLAPEYFMHGKVSDKVDVFAFGVVLLELLSGRMAISNENTKGRESLVMWAKPILEGGKVSEILDSQIGSEYDEVQIERMVLAANLCLRRSPRHRPRISLILKLLQGNEEITNWARQQVNTSLVNSAAEGEALPTDIQTHLNLALLDTEDDSLSISSTEQGVSLENYLQGRCSRTSSFD